MGCHSLLQGNLPDTGVKPGSSASRQILYCLSHQGSTSFSFSLNPANKRGCQGWLRGKRETGWAGGADVGGLLLIWFLGSCLVAPQPPNPRVRRRACPGGSWAPSGCGGRSPARASSAQHLLSPILLMTRNSVSSSSLSPDFNVICPRQLLNILNVSLTRTNPVEFFSNPPIR